MNKELSEAMEKNNVNFAKNNPVIAGKVNVISKKMTDLSYPRMLFINGLKG